MGDFLTPEARSRRMASVRTRGTAPERRLRSFLRELGVSFRSNCRSLPGSPDLVLETERLAIFVHGCFWHSHNCRHGRRRPVTRASFWRSKLAANAARDRRVQRELGKLGWRVIVVWECQLADETRLLRRLRRALEAAGGRRFTKPASRQVNRANRARSPIRKAGCSGDRTRSESRRSAARKSYGDRQSAAPPGADSNERQSTSPLLRAPPPLRRPQ